MKKICVITTSRADYGLLRWVIDSLARDAKVKLQLVATGSHFLRSQGLTYRQIETDGYKIDCKVRIIQSIDNERQIVVYMGKCALKFADVFSMLKPDLLLVLGDRYELMPIVTSALVMRIPIAHICGGDVTEGAIDNEVRNSITMMSCLHFPDSSDSAKRIKKMVGSCSNVFEVGDTSIDNFGKLKLLDRRQLSMRLSLNYDSKWVILTYHPETKITLKENLKCVKLVVSSLLQFRNIQVIITKSNIDFGGTQINGYFEGVVEDYPQIFKLFPSLGSVNYLSLMRESSLVIGNSSSGITETPYWGIPTIDIGGRQKGRHLCANVIHATAGISGKALSLLIRKAFSMEMIPDHYYGDGKSSERIVALIKKYLLTNE